MRHLLAVAAVLICTAAPAAAQLTPEQARVVADKPVVTVAVADGTWQGKLVDLDAHSVTIEPKGGPRKTLPLANVLRIDARKRDSVANGAVIGGFVTALWCALVCGQGASSSSGYGFTVVINGLTGAAIGAAIDNGHKATVSLYKRPAATPKSPALSFTVRF